MASPCRLATRLQPTRKKSSTWLRRVQAIAKYYCSTSHKRVTSPKQMQRRPAHTFFWPAATTGTTYHQAFLEETTDESSHLYRSTIYPAPDWSPYVRPKL